MSELETSGNRLSSLDFMRGIAILTVVACHVANASPSEVGPVDSLFGMGKLGVQLFFLISAMTMCHMWDLRLNEPRRTAKFYVRRVMRIAPLFWLAIVFYFVARAAGLMAQPDQAVTGLDVGLSALFLQGFWPPSINNVVPGGWSIAVEMTFYVLFPLLISRIGNRRLIYLGLAALCIAFYQLLVRDWLSATLLNGPFAGEANVVDEFIYFNFLNQCPLFLAGCYLHYALRANVSQLELAGFGVLVIASYMLLEQIFPSLCLALAATVLVFMRHNPHFTLLQKFGENSYAIYLLHFFVIDCLTPVFPAQSGVAQLLLRYCLVAAISYGLARVIHMTIERPVSGLTRQMVTALDRREPVNLAQGKSTS